MTPLQTALERLSTALAAQGKPPLAPFAAARRGRLGGEFEVRNADGSVRRMQQEFLSLPAPLADGFAHLAPAQNTALDLGSHVLTLWVPQELIELQVGFRWNGFTGKRMREWDDRYVVFAEDGGDPLAMRVDDAKGEVLLALRGEGRHHFFTAAPTLADFYEALAILLEAGRERLGPALEQRFGESAKELWLYRELVSGELARR